MTTVRSSALSAEGSGLSEADDSASPLFDFSSLCCGGELSVGSPMEVSNFEKSVSLIENLIGGRAGARKGVLLFSWTTPTSSSSSSSSA